jgi:hypothetical protein
MATLSCDRTVGIWSKLPFPRWTLCVWCVIVYECRVHSDQTCVFASLPTPAWALFDHLTHGSTSKHQTTIQLPTVLLSVHVVLDEGEARALSPGLWLLLFWIQVSSRNPIIFLCSKLKMKFQTILALVTAAGALTMTREMEELPALSGGCESFFTRLRLSRFILRSHTWSCRKLANIRAASPLWNKSPLPQQAAHILPKTQTLQRSLSNLWATNQMPQHPS